MFAGPGHPEGFTLRASVFNAPQAIHRTVLPAVVTLALSRQGSLLDGCRVEAVSHLSSSMSFRRSRRSRRPSIRCIASSWQDLADWTVAEFPEAQGTLLRDREAPNVFFSLVPGAIWTKPLPGGHQRGSASESHAFANYWKASSHISSIR